MELLDCSEVLPGPTRRQYVWDSALDLFLTKNEHKGWGFPAKAIREKISARAALNEHEKLQLYIAEIKKWFTANEQRFPEWKLGDPLPAAPELPPIPPGPESTLPLSADFTPRPTVWTVGETGEEELLWKGERYRAAEGVDLLMNVALEPGSVKDRAVALRRLERFAGRLRNTERIAQLLELYERLSERSERVAALFCLAYSADPRALPLFAETLAKDDGEDLRLPAAYGLAVWNVRYGVGELIELLSVAKTRETAILLRQLNQGKSWWMPESDLFAIARVPNRAENDAFDASYAELKKWFAENEHRFPEWKLGDPLPKVTEKEPETQGSATE